MSREDELTAAVNELHGELVAVRACVIALLLTMSGRHQAGTVRNFNRESDLAHATLANSTCPEAVVTAFDDAVARFRGLFPSQYPQDDSRVDPA